MYESVPHVETVGNSGLFRFGVEMAKKKANSTFEYVEPIGDRVLVLRTNRNAKRVVGSRFQMPPRFPRLPVAS